MTAPTGQASDMRNLAPAAPPRPLLDILVYLQTRERALNENSLLISSFFREIFSDSRENRLRTIHIWQQQYSPLLRIRFPFLFQLKWPKITESLLSHFLHVECISSIHLVWPQHVETWQPI